MALIIGRANGRGKCWNCDYTIEKGKAVIIVLCNKFAKPRYCKKCLIKVLNDMEKQK